jgi:hypothetical protein
LDILSRSILLSNNLIITNYTRRADDRIFIR